MESLSRQRTLRASIALCAAGDLPHLVGIPGEAGERVVSALP